MNRTGSTSTLTNGPHISRPPAGALDNGTSLRSNYESEDSDFDSILEREREVPMSIYTPPCESTSSLPTQQSSKADNDAAALASLKRVTETDCERWRPEEANHPRLKGMASSLIGKTVKPFLREHIPDFYAPVGKFGGGDEQGRENANSKYCYRHRPDAKCRRAADESKMALIQSVCFSFFCLWSVIRDVRGWLAPPRYGHETDLSFRNWIACHPPTSKLLRMCGVCSPRRPQSTATL
jgi:hypothetical protein